MPRLGNEQKVCLGWAVNISLLVVNLREINEFANVTLACEHGQQIEAHKVTLEASSPFFQKLLKRRGIKSENPCLAACKYLYVSKCS